MQLKFSIFLLPLAGLLNACYPPVSPDMVCFGKETTIKEGETSYFKTCPGNEIKPELSLKFADLVSDNRCSPDVTCVWEGEAIAEFSLDNGKEKIRLSTHEPKSAEYKGHIVELISVSSADKNGEYTANIIVK